MHAPPHRAPELRAALMLRDRLTIGIGLSVVCGSAWAVLAWQSAVMMPDPANVASLIAVPGRSWTPVDFGLVYLMWVAMMAAMMLPATGPMIAVFTTVNRQRREGGAPYVATAIFVAGYLIAWSLFSIAATGVHWMLDTAGLLTPMMDSASDLLSAVLFFAAGLYQWTPLKDVCLTRCRTPIGFVLTEWRDGAGGAIVMGLRHGTFCGGCCAALMGLLFAVSVMDLRWVAVLAVMVTAEKLSPWPRLWRFAIGAVLVVASVGFAARWLAP